MRAEPLPAGTSSGTPATGIGRRRQAKYTTRKPQAQSRSRKRVMAFLILEGNMRIGLDGGYNAFKAVSDSKRVTFPSLVGTPDKASFSLLENDSDIRLSVGGKQYLIGEGAMEKSRFANRSEERDWITSEPYYVLFLAALTELTTATQVDLTVVTGLPLAFYTDDKDALIDILTGEHRARREGRYAQLFRVTRCAVVPQPFGTVGSVVLDNRGIASNGSFYGRNGVMDIGGRTTNMLTVNRLGDIPTDTISVNKGGWDVVREMRQRLGRLCPKLDLRDHEIAQAVIERRIAYGDEFVDLSADVDEVAGQLAADICSSRPKMWRDDAMALGTILVTGGGALLLGEHIRQHIRRARVVDDPVFENAIGYWKLAQRIK